MSRQASPRNDAPYTLRQRCEAASRRLLCRRPRLRGVRRAGRHHQSPRRCAPRCQAASVRGAGQCSRGRRARTERGCRAHGERSGACMAPPWNLPVLLAQSAAHFPPNRTKPRALHSSRECLILSLVLCVSTRRQPAGGSLNGGGARPRQHPGQRVRERMQHVLRPDPTFHAKYD